MVPASWLSEAEGAPTTNLTTLQRVAGSGSAYARRLDPHNTNFPFEQDVTIFNRSRLMINSEGCVNTLVDECVDFYAMHGRDGRNQVRRRNRWTERNLNMLKKASSSLSLSFFIHQTSPARFPCYYAPHNGEFVVRRFDPSHTKHIFLSFFMVPATILIISCGSLFLCSRILNIDNAGHMVFRKWARTESRRMGSSRRCKRDKIAADYDDNEEEDQL